MSGPGRGFGSDNHAGAHPEVIAAIAGANEGHAPAYGADRWSAEAAEVLRGHFGAGASIHFVTNGSGANVTALRALTRGYDAVICPVSAHIHVDECGAPERVGGVKLLPLATADGKLDPATAEAAIIRVGDEHFAQPRVISISQSTELGTVYSPEEVAALAELAHRNDMYLHMDGARLANAAASLDLPLAAITADAGVDALSFGGTKNGMVLGEAVVIFAEELGAEVPFLRKQSLQLASKSRFIAAQFTALMSGELWRSGAAHANAMATRLGDVIASAPGAELAYPVQANAVFARIPAGLAEPLQSALPGEPPFHVWEREADQIVIRLMCAWDTQAGDIDRVAHVLAGFVPKDSYA